MFLIVGWGVILRFFDFYHQYHFIMTPAFYNLCASCQPLPLLLCAKISKAYHFSDGLIYIRLDSYTHWTETCRAWRVSRKFFKMKILYYKHNKYKNHLSTTWGWKWKINKHHPRVISILLVLIKKACTYEFLHPTPALYCVPPNFMNVSEKSNPCILLWPLHFPEFLNFADPHSLVDPSYN